MHEQLYDWQVEGDFRASNEPNLGWKFNFGAKVAIGTLLVSALLGQERTTEPAPAPLTPEQRYLQSASLQGPSSTIRELHGENFGTGIACVFRHKPYSQDVEYDTRSGKSVPETNPFKYKLVANWRDNRFDTVIEPGTAELYRVLVRAQGDEVEVKTLDLFSPLKRRFDERYTFTLPEGEAHFGSYGAEKYAITHEYGDFYMTFSCNDAFMRGWVRVQNEATDQFERFEERQSHHPVKPIPQGL